MDNQKTYTYRIQVKMITFGQVDVTCTGPSEPSYAKLASLAQAQAAREFGAADELRIDGAVELIEVEANK